MGNRLYNLGKMIGPKLRKGKWLWQSFTAGQADAIAAEEKVGRDLADEIKDQVGLEEHSPYNQLLNEITAKLTTRVKNKHRSFNVLLVNQSEHNAFALPGGFIVITIPMVEMCQKDPDELAFILAHEMAHVILRHAIGRIVSSTTFAAASKVAYARGPFVGWLRQAGMEYLQNSYSQRQEIDADTLAVRLTNAAGFDPAAGSRLFTRLSEQIRPDSQFKLARYFSSHPPFEVRIQNIDSLCSSDDNPEK